MSKIFQYAFVLVAVLFPLTVSAQSVHNHNQYHGFSQTIQPNLPAGTEGLFIEYRWRNQGNADVDGHVQLPTGFGPYNVTQTINFSRADQPFADGQQNRRIYPSQSGVQFNGGAAFGFHSGDQGGGAPAGVGCVEPSGGSCEVISITGNVPTAKYGIGIHNFNFFDIPNSSADYDIIVYATNGVAHIEGQESHLASNIISGTNLTTGQSHIETVNYTFTGNSPHAIGVPELISTLGYSVPTDQVQNQHQVAQPQTYSSVQNSSLSMGLNNPQFGHNYQLSSELIAEYWQASDLIAVDPFKSFDPFRDINQALQSNTFNYAVENISSDSFLLRTDSHLRLFGASLYETVMPTSNEEAAVDAVVTVATAGAGKIAKEGVDIVAPHVVKFIDDTPALAGARTKIADSTSKFFGFNNKVEIDTPYRRPSNATNAALRESVQGKPCVDCGIIGETQVADHKVPLVVEYYTTGKIDLEKMLDIDAVQPQCIGCSRIQGGQMSAYSRAMKKELELD